MKRRTYLKMTIAEPFPVFFGHVTYDAKTYDGPFYAPGLERLYPDCDRAHAEFSAAFLRGQGYTVTLDEVTR